MSSFVDTLSEALKHLVKDVINANSKGILMSVLEDEEMTEVRHFIQPERDYVRVPLTTQNASGVVSAVPTRQRYDIQATCSSTPLAI